MSAAETKAWLSSYSEWTPASLDYGSMTLNDVYRHRLEEHLDKPATWFFGRTTTYGELDKQVKGAAAGLRALGVRTGDRVVLAMPNCPQHVAAYYAILSLGAVVVEHNPLYTAHELTAPMDNHEARVAIVWDKAVPTFETLRANTSLETIVSVNMILAMPRSKQFALSLPIPKIRAAREQLHAPAKDTVTWESLVSKEIGGTGADLEPLDSITPDSPAVIMYTSGTTGTPKGAVLTHGNLYANLLQGKQWVPGMGEKEERILAALPFFHAYGMTMALTLTIFLKGEMVLVPTPKIELISDAVIKRKPTLFSGVPLLFEKTIKAAEENKKMSLESVRAAFCGAANMPADITAEWERHTSGMMVEGYGLTETSPIVIGTPMNDSRKRGYIGLPFPDTHVKIANPDNLDEIMPDGQEGEILVKAPQVFSGYLNNPEATEAAFHKGYFRTGDVGVMDPDGFVKLVARIKEVIITGGFNVFPPEVESALREHRDVADVAVVGRPRPDGSEDVVACVVLNDGAALDPEGLKDFARERLTRYKVPRTFYHFEELPTNIMGKVVRKDVQAELLSLLEKDK
ncbi:long-chain-fatty-acid--CoA ligase [Corynebacterium tapiri]|uniref:Long-chain fatty acid--CoA ligase n=1 Tax=Corynebacterium tapiri TaxID=1448266 RepID=A0A5C4U470_9CORY|nr:long-chain-fatty-acid--CoA ligase [Corynebacterium tapiri]TNL97315.1 long-chain fatty acid--CoA ligase [Corynebacterium tapiri]